MQRWMGWGIVFLVAAGGYYMHTTKPECREGFTPVLNFSVGWYCTAGYRPQ